MAEAEGIPPTASVVLPGRSLNYAGKWAFAYSGKVDSSGTDFVTLVEFTTGAGIIDFRWEYDYSSNSGDNAVYSLELNDIAVASIFVNGGVTTPSDERLHRIIIPPFTKVLFQAKNHTGNEVIFFYGRMSGRVYDV
jgi:hypothetical protein